MADPCVDDTTHIVLDTAGTPAVLTADFANVARTISATQGDYTLHIVTDEGVTHTQTQTQAIDNSAGLAAMTGIVVATFDPIWVAPDDSGEVFVWHAQLVVHAVIQDERNKSLQETPIPSGTGMWLPVGCCIGEINVPAGATHNITFTKTLVQSSGVSHQYGFLMGGDKLEVEGNFG